MRTSGLVLDVYDDFGGALLRELYPSFDAIPGTVKQAHVVTADVHQKLPDDVFALVLISGEDKLRKYACIDEGNTVLSVQYFLKNAHKLPLEAQRTAAENLKVACGWYELAVPEELEKIALGVGTALNVAMAVPTIKGTHQAYKENRAATSALRGQGVNVVSPEMRDQALGRKTAEVSGTTTAPLQDPGDLSVSPSKTVVKKTAQHLGHLVTRHPHDEHDNKGPIEGTAEVDYTHGVQVQKLPQAKHLQPTVDATNKTPPRKLAEKEVLAYALPSEKKYPLDSYACVKAASSYFDTYVRHMPPPTRHEFAVNLVKRASALSIPVSDTALKYGSEEFAPEAEIKAAFDARRIEVVHNEDALKLLGEVEKVARIRMWKEASAAASTSFTPGEVVELLAEFDKVAGLDHYYDRTIPDPYFSIYGFEKSAQDPAFSEVIGNELVTEADLKRLARIGAFSVKTTFGMDFQEEFLKDPVGIFKSLPLDQKKMLARMANSTQPGAERTYY